MGTKNPPDIKVYIHILKTGQKDEVKRAKKALESAWHTFYLPHREEGRKAFEVFLEEIKTFDAIKDDHHKADFIYGLKWAFWTIGEEYFETWVAFILKYLQSPSGKIRQAIISISDILLLDLSERDYDFEGKKTAKTDAQIIRELRNYQRFGMWVMAVEDLIQQYHEPKYNRYKYISNIPPGIYKSLQIFITQVLLRSEHYEERYQKFLNDFYTNQAKEILAN